MARYYFHLHDEAELRDSIGSDHDSVASVRAEAVETIRERLRGRLLDGNDISNWIMNVTDEAGVTVLILSLSATVQILNESRYAGDD